jgi:glutamate--cysteine ligase catalytic subunit
MEIQLTDFENAAFTVFVVLLTRIILAFDLHLYVPISKLDTNMKRAHARDRWGAGEGGREGGRGGGRVLEGG